MPNNHPLCILGKIKEEILISQVNCIVVSINRPVGKLPSTHVTVGSYHWAILAVSDVGVWGKSIQPEWEWCLGQLHETPPCIASPGGAADTPLRTNSPTSWMLLSSPSLLCAVHAVNHALTLSLLHTGSCLRTWLGFIHLLTVRVSRLALCIVSAWWLLTWISSVRHFRKQCCIISSICRLWLAQIL